MVYFRGYTISWWNVFALLQFYQHIQSDIALNLARKSQGWAKHNYWKPWSIDARLSNRKAQYNSANLLTTTTPDRYSTIIYYAVEIYL